MSDTHKTFHVLIVGGGVGGLTLAKCLELAGISYTLLEGRDQIAPQVGASIGITANGARILDQLGCYDEFLAAVEPLSFQINRYADHSFINAPTDTFPLIAARTGYHAAFHDRHLFLEILYNNITDKSRLLVKKRVANIDLSEAGVSVKCQDGTAYCGHVLVGCDGVNSVVRHSMWRLADAKSPGYIPKKDKTAMTAEYKCMYGISTKTPGICPPGFIYVGHGYHTSSLFIVNKGDRVYWFMIEKLDRVYGTHEIPKYTTEDAAEFVQRIGHWKMADTTFGEVFKNAVSYVLVPLEEANYERWVYDRIACVGDNINKYTPNAGAGGNAAIESAAALANELKQLVENSDGIPSQKKIEAALVNYESIRKPRATMVCEAANDVTRIHALRTWFHKVLAYYITPRAGDFIPDLLCNFQSGAVKLDYLPAPPRSLRGAMPFNPSSGVGRDESRVKRLLLASPLLVVFLVATQILVPTDSVVPLLTAMDDKRLFHSGTFAFPVRDAFMGFRAFDDLWRPLTICFMPSTFGIDEISRDQMITFLADVGVVYSIMLIESARRANALTFFQIPMVFGIMSQLAGGGLVLPLFFYLVLYTSQINHYKALDMRLTSMKYTSTVLISMLVCYYVPLVGQYFAASNESRHFWSWVWQPFPVTVAILQRILASTVAPDTVLSDRLKQPLRDIPAIALQVGLTAVMAAVTWIAVRWTSAYSFQELFVPLSVALPKTDFNAGIRLLLQWDWVLVNGASYLWLMYSFWDLKAAGMVRESWPVLLLGAAASTAAVGPGATFAIAWSYREYCLAYRRHKDAVVSAELPRTGSRAKGSAKA